MFSVHTQLHTTHALSQTYIYSHTLVHHGNWLTQRLDDVYMAEIDVVAIAIVANVDVESDVVVIVVAVAVTVSETI